MATEIYGVRTEQRQTCDAARALQGFRKAMTTPTPFRGVGPRGLSRGRRMSYGLYSPGPSFETLRESIPRVSYVEVDDLVRTLGARTKVTKVSRRRRLVDPEPMAPGTSTRVVSSFRVDWSLEGKGSCTSNNGETLADPGGKSLDLARQNEVSDVPPTCTTKVYHRRL